MRTQQKGHFSPATTLPPYKLGTPCLQTYVHAGNSARGGGRSSPHNTYWDANTRSFFLLLFFFCVCVKWINKKQHSIQKDIVVYQ